MKNMFLNIYCHFPRFCQPSWWRYVLSANSLTNAWCRAKGHPAGIVFYNPGGLEPDTKCSNCEEDIGGC